METDQFVEALPCAEGPTEIVAEDGHASRQHRITEGKSASNAGEVTQTTRNDL